MIKLMFLGTPAVYYGTNEIAISVKKALALIAYLAATGKPQSRERLATMFWQDATEDVARTSLRQALRALRETPLASVLNADRNIIAFTADIYSDIRTFTQIVTDPDIEKALSIESNAASLSLDVVARLQEAASYYRGDFMEDVNISGSPEWDDWLQLRRIEFHYHATQVFSTLTRYYLGRGLAESGLQMASRWLELDPHQEEPNRFLMVLYTLTNQSARAIEQYHLFARLLKREDGQTPDATTQRLYQQIRLGQPIAPEFKDSAKRSIRKLLPKPLRLLPDLESKYHELKASLGIAPQSVASPLVVLYDLNMSIAPALIAQIAHDSAVETIFTDGTLWGILEGDHDLDAIIRLWLDALRISILKSTRKTEHLIWQLHNAIRGKRVLMLLENLGDARYASLLTPGYPNCSLVVTTSKRDCMRTLASTTDQIMMLSPMYMSQRGRLS
jgi:DNA-binding SARP family transcriptional activator